MAAIRLIMWWLARRVEAVGSENLKLACATCNLGLSKQNDLKSFEARKEYINKRIIDYHEPWFQELKSKLRR